MIDAMVIDKEEVRKIVAKIGRNEWYTSSGRIDDLAIEQATNAIMSLQRPPLSLDEAALAVSCPYCGRTPGNLCDYRGFQHKIGKAHPSRIRRLVEGRY